MQDFLHQALLRTVVEWRTRQVRGCKFASMNHSKYRSQPPNPKCESPTSAKKGATKPDKEAGKEETQHSASSAKGGFVHITGPQITLDQRGRNAGILHIKLPEVTKWRRGSEAIQLRNTHNRDVSNSKRKSSLILIPTRASE